MNNFTASSKLILISNGYQVGSFPRSSCYCSWGSFPCNTLLFTGQLVFPGKKYSVRHLVKRHRFKTIIQELIYLAVNIIRSYHRLFLHFSQYCNPVRSSLIFTADYRQEPNGFPVSKAIKQERSDLLKRFHLDCQRQYSLQSKFDHRDTTDKSV